LKKFLGGRRFKNDEEVEEAVKEWLNGLVAEVYKEGIQKLVTSCEKCLNVEDNCVEKYLGVSNSDTLNLSFFFFPLFLFYSQTVFTFWMTFEFTTFTMTIDLSVSYHEITQVHPVSKQGISKVSDYSTTTRWILFELHAGVT
jgi:hypothetical protein